MVGVAVWVWVRVRARTCEEASFDEMSEDDVLCLRPDGALTLEVVIEWTRGGREEGSSNVEFPHGVAEEGEGDGGPPAGGLEGDVGDGHARHAVVATGCERAEGGWDGVGLGLLGVEVERHGVAAAADPLVARHLVIWHVPRAALHACGHRARGARGEARADALETSREDGHARVRRGRSHGGRPLCGRVGRATLLLVAAKVRWRVARQTRRLDRARDLTA